MDFGMLPLFRDSIRKVFQGEEISGSMNAMGYDQLPVTAAYSKVGDYPIAAVVEEIDGSKLSWDHTGSLHLLQNLLAAISVLMGVVLFCALILKKYVERETSDSADQVGVEPEMEWRPEEKGDFLFLDPVTAENFDDL
jgi:hypothetical protein